jgi:AcrR family transcriptional regulator
MTARKYEQRLRAESAEETRRRILDATYRRLRSAPAQPVSLDAVARDARVARSTVYAIFGSRAGLFDALTSDLWERSGYPKLVEATSDPDVLVNLRRGFLESTRMYATDRDVWRALFSMAQLDADAVGDSVKRADEHRARGMAWLARRLKRAGVLREGVGVQRAAGVLWILTSFDAADLLFTGRGLDADAAARTLLEMAERTLLATPGEG